MHTITASQTLSSSAFDKIWVQNLIISGSPGGKVTAIANLKPYNGEYTLDKNYSLVINDVFELAANDVSFAKVVGDLLVEIERQAKLQNII
jgi:hypothetical protein